MSDSSIAHRLINNPHGGRIYYQGPELSQGPLPAIIFFALSAKMSLFEDPFNQAVLHCAGHPIRIFSWDLPFHEDGIEPKEAMFKWMTEMKEDPHFIDRFLSQCDSHLSFLIQQNYITPDRIAVAGLSRGSYMATQVAAHDKRITTILGFAPLTQSVPYENNEDPSIYEPLSLSHLAPLLIHKHLRFYIGNHDQRVGTDLCFEFIKTLTETAFQSGIRSPSVELIIYPSIGHKGHGTPPYVFEEGSNWLKKQLLN